MMIRKCLAVLVILFACTLVPAAAPHRSASEYLFVPVTLTHAHGFGASAGIGFHIPNSIVSLAAQIGAQHVNSDSMTWTFTPRHYQPITIPITTPEHTYTSVSITVSFDFWGH